MKEKVKIVLSNKKLPKEAVRFQKEARIIYENQVKPQVKRAKETDTPKKVLACNNPV